jgi:hypothetical protein
VVVVLLGRAIACAGEQAAQSGGSLAQDQAAVLVHEAVAGCTADLSRLGWLPLVADRRWLAITCCLHTPEVLQSVNPYLEL